MSTRREQLEAAFEEMDDDLESDETSTEQDEVAEDGSAGSESGAGDEDQGTAGGDQETESGTDEREEGASKDETENRKQELDSQQQERKAASKLAGKERTQEQAPPDTGLKAPASWNREEKQHWAKVPKEAQQAVLRREVETTRALQNSAGARQFADQFIQTINPFAHLIRAQRSTPLDAVRNLMTTAAGLMTGNASQKAAIVAEIVGNYGVDIKELDDALAKTVEQRKNNPNAGRGSIDPALANALRPVHDFMNQVHQARTQRQQQMQEEAVEAVEEFGQERPFFDELRDDMADLMDIARSRGKKMTMDQAYDRALGMNPEIQKIVYQQRRADELKKNKKGNDLQNARRRSKTLSGGPANGGGRGAPKSRRDALSQAWDDSVE